MKKWLKSMKWAKNGFEGKNERFLSGICLDKEFFVIGFQFLVLSFQERPMDRERNCKEGFQFLVFSFQERPMDRERRCKRSLPVDICSRRMCGVIVSL